MIPSRDQLLDIVPQPTGKDEFIEEFQQTDHIIWCIWNSVRLSEGYRHVGGEKDWEPIPGFKPYIHKYANLFLDGNVTKTGNVVSIDLDGLCNDIWDFMQDNWPYSASKAETEHLQTGRTVNAILWDIYPEKFDCKHYAIFAFATLRALGAQCKLRLTSYDTQNPNASHVYVVAGLGDFNPDTKHWPEEFIIDGTMPNYNEESKEGVTLSYTVKITE